MAHTLHSHGQRGAEMRLTMGTCPVRGGSAPIKCTDPNCNTYINQVPSSAHTLLRPRPGYDAKQLLRCRWHLRDASLKCAAVSRLVHACSVQHVLQRAHPRETDQKEEHDPQLCYVGATKWEGRDV